MSPTPVILKELITAKTEQCSKYIHDINGVQAQHTKATFQHDSEIPGSENSPVIKFSEIEIDEALGLSMKNYISQKISSGATCQFIDITTPSRSSETLDPVNQKGGNNSFTCVGLIEWAAEQAGHRGGQGFINNNLESFTYNVLDEERIASFLSPELLYWSLKFSGSLVDSLTNPF